MNWDQAKQVRGDSISKDLTDVIYSLGTIETQILYTYTYFSTALISADCSQSHGHENKQVTLRAFCHLGEIWVIG